MNLREPTFACVSSCTGYITCQSSHAEFAARPAQSWLNSEKRLILETGIGGVEMYRTLEGGELAPKVALGKLGLLTP